MQIENFLTAKQLGMSVPLYLAATKIIRGIELGRLRYIRPTVKQRERVQDRRFIVKEWRGHYNEYFTGYYPDIGQIVDSYSAFRLLCGSEKYGHEIAYMSDWDAMYCQHNHLIRPEHIARGLRKYMMDGAVDWASIIPRRIMGRYWF